MIHVQELISNNDKYQLVYVLHHDQIQQFVQQYFNEKTKWVIFFKILLYMVIGTCFTTMFFLGFSNILNIDKILYSFGLGIVSFILIVPIHELIHGIGYKLIGAPKVRFKAFWRKLSFIAEAPDFVVDYKRFFPVAVAPFFIINSALLVFIIWQIQSPFAVIAGLSALKPSFC